MKFLLYILALLSLIDGDSLFSVPVEGSQELSQMVPLLKQRFESEDGAYTVLLPENWESMDSLWGADMIFVSPFSSSEDTFRENIAISHFSIDRTIDFESYFEANLKNLKNLLQDFNLEKKSDIRVDDIQSRKIIFTHRVGTIQARVLQYLAIHEGNAFIITFTAHPEEYDHFESQFHNIVKTFKFSKNSVAPQE